MHSLARAVGSCRLVDLSATSQVVTIGFIEQDGVAHLLAAPRSNSSGLELFIERASSRSVA